MSENQVKKEHSEMFNVLEDHDGFTVFKVNNPRPVKHTSDTFLYFMENWYSDLRNYIKEYQTLVLDNKKIPRYLISYEPSGVFTGKAIEDLFKIAKALPNASNVIVGRNNPGKPITPDETEKLVAIEIDQLGKEYKIPVLNQVMLSPDTMYYFKLDEHHKSEIEVHKKAGPKRDKLPTAAQLKHH